MTSFLGLLRHFLGILDGFLDQLYGPKAAGREKSALRVTKQPSLRETSWPNGWSQQLALLDSWRSRYGEFAQEFSASWDARKRVQERVKVSWNSRKSELVIIQYNPNDYKWGIFGCPKSYYYINLYPGDDPWASWAFPGHIWWFPGPFFMEILIF